jgi:hypothetical protein
MADRRHVVGWRTSATRQTHMNDERETYNATTYRTNNTERHTKFSTQCELSEDKPVSVAFGVTVYVDDISALIFYAFERCRKKYTLPDIPNNERN